MLIIIDEKSKGYLKIESFDEYLLVNDHEKRFARLLRDAGIKPLTGAETLLFWPMGADFEVGRKAIEEIVSLVRRDHNDICAKKIVGVIYED